MSGASIRNAVLRACLHAARSGRGLSTEHLVAAAERECSDLGMVVREGGAPGAGRPGPGR